MVTFDDLRISADGDKIRIQLHVADYEEYANMYIDSVYLEYYKNRGTIGVPSDKAIELYKHEAPVGSGEEDKKHSLILETSVPSSEDWPDSFRKGLFYVYVNCDGTLPVTVSSMPCGFDDTHDIAVIPDWLEFYNDIMPQVAKLANSCSPCEEFGDFEHLILMYNAFRFAVDACDWVNAESIWEDLMRLDRTVHSPSGCGCGR